MVSPRLSIYHRVAVVSGVPVTMMFQAKSGISLIQSELKLN
jgi:hypothetical protein